MLKNQRVMLNKPNGHAKKPKCHAKYQIVILSEAKNLKLRRETVLEILRFAQNDIFPLKTCGNAYPRRLPPTVVIGGRNRGTEEGSLGMTPR